jgi:DNA polymerase-3 subunit alpha
VDFVHLQCQSEYSVKNSLVRVSDLIDSVKEAGMTSVALTDDMSLFSAIKFYQKAINSGIKPIIGVKISVTNDLGIYDLLLLCQNHEGYLNLSELISKAYLNELEAFTACVSEDQLISHNKGLIMIASPVSSDISKLLLGNELELAKNKILEWKKTFDDRYYIAVQRTGRSSDQDQSYDEADLRQSFFQFSELLCSIYRQKFSSTQVFYFWRAPIHYPIVI